ncbi:MAG: hypothetical protein Kow0058_14770 [Roseovarius sp.]
MLMRRLVLLMCLVSAAPAASGQAPMTAEEFDDYTRGKTFYYGSGGEPYGAEEYLPDRRVIWTFLDGKCQNGRWYEAGGLICFVYENEFGPQCWSFTRSIDGLIARFENDPAQTELYEVQRTAEPLACPGPDVGV